MTSDFGRRMSHISDDLFKIELGLVGLIETVVRMHLVTFVSLVGRSVEDVQKIQDDQAEQFNYVLTGIKTLLDKCRSLQPDLSEAEMSAITPLVTVEERLVQAQKRLEEELQRNRKKDEK